MAGAKKEKGIRKARTREKLKEEGKKAPAGTSLLLGNFMFGTRQFCDAAGSNFSKKRRPAHGQPYRFTASRGVENASQKYLASCRKREL